jgi:hypothetical protein
MDSCYDIDIRPAAAGRVSDRADLPKAIDFTHHLNELARDRTPSSLKELYKYATIPGEYPILMVLTGRHDTPRWWYPLTGKLSLRVLVCYDPCSGSPSAG